MTKTITRRIGKVTVKFVPVTKRIVVCPRCGNEWEPVVPRPKKCPACQKRLEWEDDGEE